MEWKAKFYQSPDSEPTVVNLVISDQDLKWTFENGVSQFKPLSALLLTALEGSGKLIIKSWEGESWSILVEDEYLAKHLQVIWPSKKNLSSGPRHWAPVAIWSIMGFITILALIFIGLWKINPFLADKLASGISTEWELENGDKMLNTILSESTIDTSRTRVLRAFYQKLTPLSVPNQERQRAISLTVLDKDELNAFAIPGRHILIYSGAVKKMDRYEQLMALIGHEAGHVENRHSIRSMVRAGTLYLVISLTFGDLTGLSALFIDQARNLQNLSYSRDFEREADIESHHFLCQNGADIKATFELMTLLNEEKKASSQEIPPFLQSHPLTEERMEMAKKTIEKEPCQVPVFHRKDLDSLFQILKNKTQN